MYFTQNAETGISPPPRLDLKDSIQNLEILDQPMQELET